MFNFRSALLILSIQCVSTAHANVDAYFNQIKHDPKALYNFFEVMPKGGELHYHLAGGPSPETMLSLVSQANYCLDETTMTISKEQSPCIGIRSNDISSQSPLYSQIIQDWSMEGFKPGKESGHDHFFNGFMKYMPIVFNYRPQLIAAIIQKAAAQNEQYLEIMDITDNAQSLAFGALLNDKETYDEKRKILLNNPDFQKNVTQTILVSDEMGKQAREELGCTNTPTKDVCLVKVKFLYYVLREQPLNNFFAQALNAFEAVSRSQNSLVGVNLVQPEDGVISLRDYQQQMRIFNYLHTLYPQVHISLHAGEVTADLVKPDDLKYHIYEALFTGKAERIGHGVDIVAENKADLSTQYMAKQHIPVEINLISNLKILNVAGDKHPLNYYLKHNVPVVLSTDDEGVLRTNLTEQYVIAAFEHHLSYQSLKQINRNTLTYAFVSGKSIWANPDKAELVPECLDLNSTTCATYIAANEKALLQWQLETKLIAFESK